MKTALVLGAGGFIGSHLVNRLKSEGYWVRGVDLKYPEYSKSQADEFLIYDLRNPQNVEAVIRLHSYYPGFFQFHYLTPSFSNEVYFDEVYQLAADMGGAGFVFTGEHDADIMHNSALINLNVCNYINKKSKVFYSSSACMYPQELQSVRLVSRSMRSENGIVSETGDSKQLFGPLLTENPSLKESDAYPGNPDSEYGWEKLFSERLFLAYARNYDLDVRIARFHNIYGPEGTYKGGREKAPAAMCRKVIESENVIEVWGTGHQTRSFLYIDDCIDAVRLLMQSEFKQPINIGSEEMVTINQLAQMAIDLSGKHIKIKNISGPTGVMGRNSDNTLIEKELGWKPKFTLRQGLEKTYLWIKSQYE